MKKQIITSIFVIVIVLGFVFGSNLEIPYKYTVYILILINKGNLHSDVYMSSIIKSV